MELYSKFSGILAKNVINFIKKTLKTEGRICLKLINLNSL